MSWIEGDKPQRFEKSLHLKFFNVWRKANKLPCCQLKELIQVIRKQWLLSLLKRPQQNGKTWKGVNMPLNEGMKQWLDSKYVASFTILLFRSVCLQDFSLFSAQPFLCFVIKLPYLYLRKQSDSLTLFAAS